MKQRFSLLAYFVLFVLFFNLNSVSADQKESISPAEAHKFVGETKTVCGKVASATYAARSRGRPTFLNLDQPYPRQVFTVVIWGSDRNRFKSPPEVFFKGKRICVTGVIGTYRGKAEVIVRDPSQITIPRD
jgi:DNA/RNA endonuclease YhcR with UshA esterase domain